MKPIYFLLIVACFSNQLFAQTQTDSTLTQEELNFRDSIVAINQSNEDLQLLQQTYNKASDFFSSGQFKQAIESYSQVVAIDSVYVLAYYNRGLSYKELKQYDLAILDMDRSYKLDSTNLDPLIQKAKCLALNNQNSLAIDLYKLVSYKDPSFSEGFYESGVLQYLDKDYDNAVNSFSAAIKVNSEYYYAYNDRGSSYRALEKFDLAIADYKKAIEINAQSFIYNNLGSVLKRTGSIQEAVDAFSKAISIDSQYELAYNNRGAVYFENDDFDKAISDFNKALELNPNYSLALINRAAVLHQQKQYSAALDDLNKAIELQSNNGIAFLNRGIVKEMLRDVDGACEDWQIARNLGISKGRDYFINNCE
jgi:tetratricopeptide (TPR) repeat protein